MSTEYQRKAEADEAVREATAYIEKATRRYVLMSIENPTLSRETQEVFDLRDVEHIKELKVLVWSTVYTGQSYRLQLKGMI